MKILICIIQHVVDNIAFDGILLIEEIEASLKPSTDLYDEKYH